MDQYGRSMDPWRVMMMAGARQSHKAVIHCMVEVTRHDVMAAVAVEPNSVRRGWKDAQAVPEDQRQLGGGHAEGMAYGVGAE